MFKEYVGLILKFFYTCVEFYMQVIDRSADYTVLKVHSYVIILRTFLSNANYNVLHYASMTFLTLLSISVNYWDNFLPFFTNKLS